MSVYFWAVCVCVCVCTADRTVELVKLIKWLSCMVLVIWLSVLQRLPDCV